MKRRINQKIVDVSVFLVGVREKRILSYLSPLGFSPLVLDDGWARFHAAGQASIEALAARVDRKNPTAQLDEYENRWLPIVKLVLDRNFPQISTIFFANLGSAHGNTVTANLSLFIRLLATMEKGEPPFGPDGVKARQLLVERGLTSEVVTTMSGLLDDLQKPSNSMGTEEATALIEKRDAAEKAMWDWYGEWSGLARKVIKEPALLRLMGLGKRKVRTKANGESEVLDVEGEEVLALPSAPSSNAAE